MAVRITLKRSSILNKRPTSNLLDPGELALNTNALSPGLFFEAENNSVIKVGPTSVGDEFPTLTPSLGETFFNEVTGSLSTGVIDPDTLQQAWKQISSPFLGGTNGYVVFVAGEFPSATDSILNDGQANPFKTLNRAVIEIAKQSILQNESDLDANNRFTIVVAPGYVPVYNGPGLPLVNPNNPDIIPEFNTRFEGPDAARPDVMTLQTFNPETGGLILPRGTTIMGMDLRKVELRPSYVPTYKNPTTLAGVNEPITGVIKWTGNSLVQDLSFRDKNPLINVSDIIAGEAGEGVFVSSRPHCFGLNDRVYFQFTAGADQRPIQGGTTAGVPPGFYYTYPITPTTFLLSYTFIRETEANFITRIQLPATPQTVGILATCQWPGRSHNRLRAVYPASEAELNDFYIRIQKAFPNTFNGKTNQAEVVNPGETVIVANTPASLLQSTESNSTNNGSPYIINCTVRSNYGMCGMEVDGDITSGFRSSLADSFSVVSLQNDPVAYEVYTTLQDASGIRTTSWYTLQYATWASIPSAIRPESPSAVSNAAQMEFLNATEITNIRYYYTTEQFNEESIGVPDLYNDFRHFAVRALNKGYAQVDSSWSIGCAVGFWSYAGGGLTATNCASNFGTNALRSEGYYRIGKSTLTVETLPSETGFLFQGIRVPEEVTQKDTLPSLILELGAVVTSIEVDLTNPAVQLVNLAPGFKPINILPYSLATGTAVYIRVSAEKEIRGIFIDDGYPTVVFSQDGRCSLRIRANDSSFPYGTPASIPGMSSWSPYISRWNDPRPLRNRIYSMILGNSNTTHLPPTPGKILQLNQSSSGATLYKPGVQLDPGPTGGWGRIFQVAFSETQAEGNSPTLNEVLLNRIDGAAYYSSFQLCDGARPWVAELDDAHGAYVTFSNRNWYAASNNNWNGVYFNGDIQPTGEIKLDPQQTDSPWAVSFSTEIQVPVKETFQGIYAPDPYRDLYPDGSYFRGNTGSIENFFLQDAVNIDNGTGSKGLLRYDVPIREVVTDTTEILLPDQTKVTVNDVSKIPDPKTNFVVMSITNTKYLGRIEYVQILDINQTTKTLTMIRGLYNTETTQDWDSGSSMQLQKENTVVNPDDYDFAWAPSKQAMTRFLQVMGYKEEDIRSLLRPRGAGQRNIAIQEISIQPNPQKGYASTTGPWPLQFATNSFLSATSHSFHSCGTVQFSKGLPIYERNQIPLKQYFDYLATSLWGGDLVATGVDENGNIVSQGEAKELSTGRPAGTTSSILNENSGGTGGGGGGGGGGSGTVTAIFTGDGLTGGPIFVTGTISLKPATDFSIGGIKVGKYLSASSDGTLTIKGLEAKEVLISPIIGIPADNVQDALLDLQTEIQALGGSSILAGTYNCATGTVIYATPAGAAKGFIPGQNVPPANVNIDNYYVIVITGGNKGPAGVPIPPTNVQPGDWFIAQADSGTTPTWILIDYDNRNTVASLVGVEPSIPGIENATNVQTALELIELQVQDRIEFVVPTTEGLQIEVVPPTTLPDDLEASNDGTTLRLGLDYSNTSQKGIVQLTNDLTGTSEELAITQRAGSILESEIQALVGVNVLAGTYDALTGLMVTVTVAGSIHNFSVGQPAPPASIVPDNYFIIVVVAGPKGPPGAVVPLRGVQPGDWYIVQKDVGVSEWVTIDFDNRTTAAVLVSLASVPGLAASNVQTGIEELAAQTWDSVDKITSLNDGITIVSSAPQPGTGVDVTVQLNTARETDIGGVFVPQTTDGGILLSPSGGLSLKIATTTTLGGVKVGKNLEITPDGTLSAIDAATTYADEVLLRTPIVGIDAAANVQEALQGIENQVADRVEKILADSEGITISTSVPTPGVDGLTSTLTLAYANLSQKGIVQLTNDITGTSETLVPTQAAIAGLNSKVEALTGSNILAGTYDSSRGIVVQPTIVGRLTGFVAGQQAPPAASVPDNYYVIVTIGGDKGPPGAQVPATLVQPGDWFIVQKETGQPAEWFCIDYENRATTAALVAVTPIPGISASNVQVALEQEATALWNRVDAIRSTNDGITVTTSIPNPGTGLDVALTLNKATEFDLGAVYVPGASTNGIGLDASGGVSLKIASNTQLGGIKVGANLSIDPDGTLNAEGGAETFARNVIIDPVIGGIEQARNAQQALELLELQVQDRIEFVKATTDGLIIDVTPPSVTAYDGTTLNLGMKFASISQPGIVQLTNDPTGISETIAPTQFALSVLNAKVDALAGSNILAGTYNAKTGLMVSTTAAGFAKGFRVGAQAPDARTDLDNYYIIITVSGDKGPPGAVIPITGSQSGDWFIIQDDIGVSEWLLIDFENRDVVASSVFLSAVPGLGASNVQSGISELAQDLWNAIGFAVPGNNGIGLSLTNATPGDLRRLTVSLNPATSTDIGGVYVAPNNGLLLDSNGSLALAIASPSNLGGIKVGSGLSITPDGTLSADAGPAGVDVKLVNLDAPFDGSKTAFQMLSGGVPFAPKASHYVMIVVGGIVQSANDAYTTTGDTINFTEAPPTGATFYSIGFG